VAVDAARRGEAELVTRVALEIDPFKDAFGAGSELKSA
jgi:hypothetical protein